MLRPGHADRRQFGDLVATESPTGPALLLAEPAPAPAAHLRVMINDLIDLILRPQPTTRTRVPKLPAGLAPPPSRRISSFAFARASARRCARVLGGSNDGDLELVRES